MHISKIILWLYNDSTILKIFNCAYMYTYMCIETYLDYHGMIWKKTIKKHVYGSSKIFSSSTHFENAEIQ